jgi:hypothetical protein
MSTGVRLERVLQRNGRRQAHSSGVTNPDRGGDVMARYDAGYRNRPFRGSGRNPDAAWGSERGRGFPDESRWSGMWRRGFGYDTGYGDEYRGSGSSRTGYGAEFRGGESGRGGYGGEFGGRESPFEGPMRGRSGGYAGEFERGRFLRDAGYDDEFRTVGLGYGEEYKSRWQTEQGDPFGDRERHTPMRMMRGAWGEFGDDYGRAWRERGYGREFGPRRGGR